MDKGRIAAGAVAVAMIGGGIGIVSHNPKHTGSNGLYQVEKQPDNKFTVYQLKDGKKALFGKDLSSDQADQMLREKSHK